ncbi:cathepsin L [Halyomorpha halys]|uniref:cathepsin L n=1 Tax=Halyomorpha halys TaxID=286706 RepID=UPI0006D4CB38|nr:cathepsin L1-like [Halyomorpha halys]KAE8573697.1 Cat14 [Halyomorpha halys]
MKIILFVVLFVTLASSTPSVNVQWLSFKKQHGKSYKSHVEEQRRLSIFMKNMKLIEEHNAQFKAGLVSYYLKMNHLGDMFPEEFNSAHLGLKPVEIKKEGKPTEVFFVPPSNDVIPASIDWRELGAVTSVKNQGSCGSCWAFSTTGAVEGQLFRKTGKLVSLSEQQLMDCSVDYNNLSCKGGLMDNAFQYLKYVGGLESEDSYPYEARDGYCTFKPWKSVSGTVIKSYVDVEFGDLAALQNAVATVGPVSVAVSAGNNNFRFYGGGVFNGNGCNPLFLDHGVLVVGYGSENGKNYWIIKNSWGPNWGEEGYMRLEKNDENLCGLAYKASYPVL